MVIYYIYIKYRLNSKMEEKGIFARDCCPGLSPARAPLPAGAPLPRCPPEGDNPGTRAAFSGQRGSGRQSRATIADSFSTMAEITPTTTRC